MGRCERIGSEITQRVEIPVQEIRHNVAFLDRKRERGAFVSGEGRGK